MHSDRWPHCQCNNHVSCLAIVQGTLDNLRKACDNTKIMCAIMLDTKVCGMGPACAYIGEKVLPAV